MDFTFKSHILDLQEEINNLPVSEISLVCSVQIEKIVELIGAYEETAAGLNGLSGSHNTLMNTQEEALSC